MARTIAEPSDAVQAASAKALANIMEANSAVTTGAKLTPVKPVNISNEPTVKFVKNQTNELVKFGDGTSFKFTKSAQFIRPSDPVYAKLLKVAKQYGIIVENPLPVPSKTPKPKTLAPEIPAVDKPITSAPAAVAPVAAPAPEITAPVSTEAPTQPAAQAA